MKQFTTILIIVLFSGVLSAQNTTNTLPSDCNSLVKGASINLSELNQTIGFEKQLAELAGTDNEGMKFSESESFSGISKRGAINQQNKIYDLKERITVPEKKQKIGFCDIGACDIETSNTGFWVFISAVAFAFSAFVTKGN